MDFAQQIEIENSLGHLRAPSRTHNNREERSLLRIHSRSFPICPKLNAPHVAAMHLNNMELQFGSVGLPFGWTRLYELLNNADYCIQCYKFDSALDWTTCQLPTPDS